MVQSLLAIIPTAAIVGGAASFLTSVWREKYLQNRADERIRFELEWKMKSDKLERLYRSRRDLPRLGFPSIRNKDGQPLLDVEQLMNLIQEFCFYTDREVKPILNADGRSRIEEPQKIIQEWIGEMNQAFHGKQPQPEVPGNRINQLYASVDSAILDEIDKITLDISQLSTDSAQTKSEK